MHKLLMNRLSLDLDGGTCGSMSYEDSEVRILFWIFLTDLSDEIWRFRLVLWDLSYVNRSRGPKGMGVFVGIPVREYSGSPQLTDKTSTALWQMHKVLQERQHENENHIHINEGPLHLPCSLEMTKVNTPQIMWRLRAGAYTPMGEILVTQLIFWCPNGTVDGDMLSSE